MQRPLPPSSIPSHQLPTMLALSHSFYLSLSGSMPGGWFQPPQGSAKRNREHLPTAILSRVTDFPTRRCWRPLCQQNELGAGRGQATERN